MVAAPLFTNSSLPMQCSSLHRGHFCSSSRRSIPPCFSSASVPTSNIAASNFHTYIMGFSSSPEQGSEFARAEPKPESFTGCGACGRAEIEQGCNGQGRIQGGIGVIPGFGWWPIKAYRPCPAFLQAGGRYRRSGQSLDEIAFGRKGKGDDLDVKERFKQ